MNTNNVGNETSPEEVRVVVERLIRRDIPLGSHFNVEDVVDLLGSGYPVEAVTSALSQIEQRGEVARLMGSEPAEYRRLK